MFTRHDMNYGQVWYPTLVDRLMNFTEAEPLFGTDQKMVRPKQVVNDQKIKLAPNFSGPFFVKKNITCCSITQHMTSFFPQKYILPQYKPEWESDVWSSGRPCFILGPHKM